MVDSPSSASLTTPRICTQSTPSWMQNLPILRHHHRAHQNGRDVFESDPLAVIAAQQNEIAQHQRRNRMDEARRIKDDQQIGQDGDRNRDQKNLAPAPAQGLAPSPRTAGRHVLFLQRFRYNVHP